MISYLRRATDPSEFVIVICNFTPVVRRNYRIGVPEAGTYQELLNSDSSDYGGSDTGNSGGVKSNDEPAHGMSNSLSLTLPPLGVLILKPEKISR